MPRVLNHSVGSHFLILLFFIGCPGVVSCFIYGLLFYDLHLIQKNLCFIIFDAYFLGDSTAVRQMTGAERFKY